MRYIIFIVLCCLLALIQNQIWWDKESSYVYAQALKPRLQQLQHENEQARLYNAALQTQIDDLKKGTEMIEDHARTELGMIKPNEVLVVLY